jgi:signal transduction histidine kinase
MTEDQDPRLRKLRHDIANPLAAILAEAQLALLRANELDAETVASFREIESSVRRIRDLLQQG